MELPFKFTERMKNELGAEYEAFMKTYADSAQKGVRVNTLKISVDEFKRISPFALFEVPWEKCGFYVSGEGLGKTIYHAAGLYYVQEPSAMSVAPELEVGENERALDLCSAPGGKGTQLAQYMNGSGILFLNEINFPRAKILSSNIERLGVTNAVVTCASPESLAGEFENYFDKILIDAPCSGEGMFRKEEGAVAEWSEEAVTSCAKRQGLILECAYKMLACGGRAVYSTCTFAPEEDELQIYGFLERHEDCRLIKMNKLYPHKIRGEGHFYAVIEKSGVKRRDLSEIIPTVKDKKILSAYREWEREFLKIKMPNVHLVGQTLYSLPNGMPKVNVQTLRAGIRLGEYKGRFEPSHSLAMCLKKNDAYFIDVDEATAYNYLHGLTFSAENDINGWRIVAYNGYALGWCKVSNGVAKNKLPKGVRI